MENIKLSLFNGLSDTVPTDIRLEEIFRMITSDSQLQELTERHRALLKAGLTKDADKLKFRAPCFSVAVRFEGGKKQANIAEWSYLCPVDIDDIPAERMEQVWQAVISDVHSLLAYPTLSGEGIRVLYAVCYPDKDFSILPLRQQLKLYKEAFLQGNNHYATLIGYEFDGQCKDCTRISAMAFAPRCHYNREATPFEVKNPTAERPQKLHRASIDTAAKAVVRELAKRNLEYRAGHHNEYIMQAGYLLNRYGVPQAEAEAWALQQFADYGQENVSSILTSCYGQTEEHGTMALPRRRTEPSNVASIPVIKNYLKEKVIQIRHNCITRKHEIFLDKEQRWENMTQRTENSLYCDFCTDTGHRMNINDLRAIIASDFYPEFNPFRSYLESLPAWDGYDYIEELAESVHVAGNSQKLHNRFFKKWFVAMLPTWLENVVNHEILTYIGKQGIYKSTFMRMLLPPELQPYFAARNFAQRLNKDDKLELTEMGLIALEELDHMKPSEVNQLKAITSQHYMNERAVYERYKEQRPHIASFCGTGNHPQFLNDPTGNRRWLPFLVDAIDSPWECPFNYNGLYSQAYALWQGGFQYWFSEAENIELERHNYQFEEPSLEKELIQTYFRKPHGNEPCEFLTATRIIELVNGSIKAPLSTRGISLAMSQLGYPKRRVNNLRGWNVVILNGEDIKNRQKFNSHESELC